jgi:diguanylate cyclase (GGDEF)-like protein/PAS domain S-box-containing protein
VSTRKLIAAYAVWMSALVCAYYAFPTLHIYFWSAIGVTSACAVAFGTWRNRPRRWVPWALVAMALFVFMVGDTTYLVLTDFLGQDNPFPSLADVFYLAMYVLLVASLLLIPRSATWRDRAGLIDALILTAGLGLLSWIFLINPWVQASQHTTLERVTSVAYPLFDVLVFVTAARLVTAVRRTPAVGLLAVGGVALLVSDVLYGLSQLHGDWNMGGPVDIGWVVFYATWGAAALHPSMVSLTEPRIARDTQVTGLRLVVLTLSALVAPAVLYVEATTGTVDHGQVVALFSAVIFLLVLIRLAGVVGVHSQAVARERGLREAGAALVSATDAAGVTAAVRAAVARLIPRGTDHRVVLAIHDPADDRPRIDRPSTLAGPSAPTSPASPAAFSGAGARFVHTRELDPDTAAALGDFEITLVQPLSLDDRPSGAPLVGALHVSADDNALVALSGAVDVLASQAALAHERITLNNEITRRDSEEYFRTLVHNTADVILILDEDNRIRYASPSAATVFGDETLAGRALRDVVHPGDRELARQVLELVRGGHDGAGIADWTVLRRGGDLVQVEASCRDLRADRTVRGLVLTLRDVTERRRLERELTHQAFHDSLTGLANRVLFQERVQQAIARARWSGAVVGVLFLDLDDLKVVNDTLGHEIGDHLLAAVGQKLFAALRSHDTAARLGGDEFAALIEDARSPEDVEQVAERISATLAEPFVLGGSLVSGSASIGVATTAEAGDERELLRQADLALYVAKGAGKGRWRRYQSALHTAIVERLELRTALDQAVTDQAFALRYQPIVALLEGTTVGFEALVRWQHPARGLIPPGQFIDVAEDSGLIVPIGNWVLAKALADSARWSRTPSQSPFLSINASARQFRTPGFVDRILKELEVTGLPPHCLMLEITESLLLRDDEQVWHDLTTLRDRGVRIAIDDFGTGYSSLSYLRQVPVDVVKIDKSFIDTMSSSQQQRALVDGIVRLAQTLGLLVVAEGIERPTDRDLLVDMGCPLGQGFLFSPPLSDKDVVGWLLAEQVAA